MSFVWGRRRFSLLRTSLPEVLTSTISSLSSTLIIPLAPRITSIALVWNFFYIDGNYSEHALCLSGCLIVIDNHELLLLGRTARATNTGTAYTFFTVANIKQSKDLINVLKEANQVCIKFPTTTTGKSYTIASRLFLY